jgi:hypothetical protein
MAYTVRNFQTKKALREAVAKWYSIRSVVRVYQPGPFGPEVKDGAVSLEGPHYPEPHRWYASAEVKDGAIVPGSVK